MDGTSTGNLGPLGACWAGRGAWRRTAHLRPGMGGSPVRKRDGVSRTKETLWQRQGGVTDTSVTGNKLFMFFGRSGKCGPERRWLGGELTAPWTE